MGLYISSYFSSDPEIDLDADLYDSEPDADPCDSEPESDTEELSVRVPISIKARLKSMFQKNPRKKLLNKNLPPSVYYSIKRRLDVKFPIPFIKPGFKLKESGLNIVEEHLKTSVERRKAFFGMESVPPTSEYTPVKESPDHYSSASEDWVSMERLQGQKLSVSVWKTHEDVYYFGARTRNSEKIFLNHQYKCVNENRDKFFEAAKHVMRVRPTVYQVTFFGTIVDGCGHFKFTPKFVNDDQYVTIKPQFIVQDVIFTEYIGVPVSRTGDPNGKPSVSRHTIESSSDATREGVVEWVINPYDMCVLCTLADIQHTGVIGTHMGLSHIFTKNALYSTRVLSNAVSPQTMYSSMRRGLVYKPVYDHRTDKNDPIRLNKIET